LKAPKHLITLKGVTDMKRVILSGGAAALVFALALTLSGAQSYAQQKMKISESQKGWLGVAIQDITSEMKKAMDLDSRDGALVSDVTRKSPADSAGLKEKDVIVQFGGKKISEASDLTEAVGGTKPGTKVDVVVMRKGEKKIIGVVIGKHKGASTFVAVAPRGISNFAFFGGQHMQGMSLRQLNEQLAQYFGVTEGSGVLVWEVSKGSAAEKAGVKAGDIVTVIGKKKIKELRDVSRALGIYDEGEKAEIEVVRKGSRQTLSLEIEEGGDNEGHGFWFDSSDGPHGAMEMFRDGRTFNLRVPKIHREHVTPDLDELKIEMHDLQEKIKDETGQLREKILKEVRPRVGVRIRREI
jgi:serine protease Do